MPLSQNLAAAQKAVKHVRSLKLKACNKVSDRIAAAGGIDNVIGTTQGMRAFDKSHQASDLGPAGTGLIQVRSKSFTNLRAQAAHNSKSGFGNCQEQAEIALVHLYDAGIRPLDLMRFSAGDPYDHVWVGVGLHKGWQPDNLRSWGADAVWCDPWQGDGMAFSIADLVAGKVRNLNAQYLCDSVERIEAGRPKSQLRID